MNVQENTSEIEDKNQYIMLRLCTTEHSTFSLALSLRERCRNAKQFR